MLVLQGAAQPELQRTIRSFEQMQKIRSCSVEAAIGSAALDIIRIVLQSLSDFNDAISLPDSGSQGQPSVLRSLGVRAFRALKFFIKVLVITLFLLVVVFGVPTDVDMFLTAEAESHVTGKILDVLTIMLLCAVLVMCCIFIGYQCIRGMHTGKIAPVTEVKDSDRLLPQHPSADKGQETANHSAGISTNVTESSDRDVQISIDGAEHPEAPEQLGSMLTAPTAPRTGPASHISCGGGRWDFEWEGALDSRVINFFKGLKAGQREETVADMRQNVGIMEGDVVGALHSSISQRRATWAQAFAVRGPCVVQVSFQLIPVAVISF